MFDFGTFYFGSLISETFYLTPDKFRTAISDKNVGHFAETFCANKTRISHAETSMKIVVLHGQQFAPKAPQKNTIRSLELL